MKRIQLLILCAVFISASYVFAQEISVSATTLNFGEIFVNESAVQQLTIYNAAGAPAYLEGIASTTSANYNVIDGNFKIAPGGSHIVTVQFLPTSAGNKNAPLTVAHNATNVSSPRTVSLIASAKDRIDASFSATNLDWRSVDLGLIIRQDFYIYNDNSSTANLTGTASLIGSNGPDFVIQSGTNFDIAPGGSHRVAVEFGPNSEGSQEITLSINHNATNMSSPEEVALTGYGFERRDLSITQTSVDFGDVEVGELASTTIRLEAGADNSANVAVNVVDEGVADFMLVNGPAYNIPPGETREVIIAFEPQSAGSHTGSLRLEHDATNLNAPDEVALSGTGIVTIIDMEVTPLSLDFGGVTIGKSHGLTFTVSNDANSTDNLTGTVADNRAEFSIVEGSSLDIPPGASQEVRVLFEPTSAGAKSGKVRIEHNATNENSPLDLTIAGEGLENTDYPYLNVDVNSIQFGDVSPGSSTIRTLVMLNINPDVNFAGGQWDNLQGTVSIVDGDDSNGVFSIVGGAEFDIPAGTAHEIAIRFDAGQANRQEGANLAINHNGRNTSPLVYFYAEANITAGSLIAFDQTSLGFSVVPVGETREMILTISNDATAAVNLSGTVTENDADYSIVSGASFDIAPGGSHEVTVQFAPTEIGSIYGTLNVGHNASNEPSPKEISLVGVGLGAMMTIGGDPLDFGNVEVGHTKDIIVNILNQNSSNTNLTGTVTVDGADFSVLNGSFNLVPDETHEVTVRFMPTSAGPKTGSLRIEHSAINVASPIENIPLSGTGFGQTSDAILNLNATSINFGDVPLGQSAIETVRITNGPDSRVTSSQSGHSVQAGDTLRGTLAVNNNHYEILDAAEFSLAYGESYSVRIKFSGTAEGEDNGGLRIRHNASNVTSPYDIPLTGNVTPPEIVMELDNTELDFGSVTVNEWTTTTLTISNVYGSTSGHRSGLTPPDVLLKTETSGPFNLVGTVTKSNEDFSIISGATFDIEPRIFGGVYQHTVTIRFKPTAIGAISGTLFIEHNAVNYSSPVEIPMQGTGVQPSNIDISRDKNRIDFGNVIVGATGQEILTIFNDAGSTGNLTGTAALINSNLTAGSILNLSGSSFDIAPGGQHQITFSFEPGSAGSNTATLEVTHNATNVNSPVQMQVQGNAIESGVYMALDASGLDFGNVIIGNSRSKRLTISNASASTENLTGSLSKDSDEFDISDTNFNIAPGGSQQITVVFTPSATGNKSATLSIAHNATNQSSPTAVPMQGKGTNQNIDMNISRTRIDFGAVPVGENRQHTIMITNAASSAANLIGKVELGSSEFIVANGNFDIAPGDNHEVAITFSPDSLGDVTVVMEITHNATNLNSPAELSVHAIGAGVVMLVDTCGIDFGEVVPGNAFTDTLFIYNETASIDSLKGTIRHAANIFEIADSTFSIAPGDSQKIAITFTPDSEGMFADTLEIVHNALNLDSLLILPLAGKGANTIIAISVDSSMIDFDQINVGDTASVTLLIFNGAQSTEHLTGTISENSGNFTVSALNINIAPGDSHAVIVSFIPESEGSKSAMITIDHNATNVASPLTILLQGEAVALPTGISDSESVIANLQLYPNYPNPFNPETTIRYALVNDGKVTLTIYNILGRRVRTLIATHQNQGEHTVVWNGRDELGQQVPSGLYFYQLITGQVRITRRMLLLK